MLKRKNLLFLLLLFNFACKKDKTITFDVGYNYQPVEVGDTWIYQADSIIYDEFTKDSIHLRFQIKEWIESEFTDNSGDIAYKLLKYKRTDETFPWKFQRAFVIKKTPERIERVEENTRFVKLIFPVKELSSWNVNAYNDSTAQTYKYKDINKKLKIGNYTYDSTMMVLQKEKINIIETYKEKERYAKNIGMVYKESIFRNTDSTQLPIFNEGVEYYLNLLSFTKDTAL